MTDVRQAVKWWHMLNERQRSMLSEKLADLGNVAVGSLVFGYILRSDVLNQLSLIFGVIMALLAYLAAIAFKK